MLFLLTIVLGNLNIFAQAQASPQMAAANALFSAQKWTEAISAYEAVLKSEPNNANAFYQIGMAQYSLKQYAPAADAFEKNIAISNGAFAMFNLACVYSLMNQKDKAIEWLTKTVNNPKAPLAAFNFDDPDLNNVREDSRFKTLTADVDRKIFPCKYTDQARQFDFFIGEWDAYNPQGVKNGSSVIQSIADGCGILENWSNAGNGGGKSINFYDKYTEKWYEYWIGGNGVPLRYSGIYKDGALRYEGEAYNQNGKKVLSRLTFFNIDQNTVRQLAENSSDDGKTWTTLYDFKYVRRKK